ncbi:MAG: 23S rRNA (pseudouridine(1915)-N(3))-methyltransferase RlmH [Pseudomonadota bacterium]
MNIELLAAGTKPPAWIEAGFGEYQKRLSGHWPLEVREIAVARRGKNPALDRLKQEEGDRMLAAVRPGAKLVALDRTGTGWSTETLAQRLDNWALSASHLQIMIGGPDGLAQQCTDQASEVWSLSALTFPHFLVRVIVAEQLYRAWTIQNNHPYHK